MIIKNLLFAGIALSVTLSLTSGIEAQTKKTTSVKRPVAGQKGSLAVDAGLVFKNGDVKPVARVLFRLLDEDFEKILQGSSLAPQAEGKMSLIEYYAGMTGYGRSQGL